MGLIDPHNFKIRLYNQGVHHIYGVRNFFLHPLSDVRYQSLSIKTQSPYFVTRNYKTNKQIPFEARHIVSNGDQIATLISSVTTHSLLCKIPTTYMVSRISSFVLYGIIQCN